MLGFGTRRVNGTIVLEQALLSIRPVLLGCSSKATLVYDFSERANDYPAPMKPELPALDTLRALSVAWTLISCRRSSVVERGSHNP